MFEVASIVISVPLRKKIFDIALALESLKAIVEEIQLEVISTLNESRCSIKALNG